MFRKKKILFMLLVLIILLLPVWMWIAWEFTPSKKLNILIVDKTVLTQKCQEHVSLNWMLGNRKYVKANDSLYVAQSDYYGFFPSEDKKYRIKGLESLSNTQIDSFSKELDMAYFTDTYGIYRNEWMGEGDAKEHSRIIYGGLCIQDIRMMENIKNKKNYS